jgi:AcrR family transcriptional regulator
MPRPRADRDARRAELTAVAVSVFAERGVANTAVSDIVKAAGIAQGTFYLYFDTKDDIVMAVVDQTAAAMVEAIEAEVADRGAGAVEKFLALRDVFAGFQHDQAVVDLAGVLHRPENRALHDRLSETFTPRLLPLVEAIVAQGVTEGVFDVPDTRAAAWFVLGGLQSADLSGTPVEEMPAALNAAAVLALRALGSREDPT